MVRALKCVVPLLFALYAGAAPAAEPLAQRELNYGYAQLYDIAKDEDLAGKILLIKFESEPVERFIKDLSESMEGIKRRLDELARADPRIKLDDDGLPELEKRKRRAVQLDRLAKLKPLTGKTGRDFERTLLLSQSGALHQIEFLISELDRADADPRRSAFLKEAHATTVRLYGDVVALLEKSYFN